MGCGCGGSKQQKASEVSARRRAASEQRQVTGPKAPGYYSGPKRVGDAAKAPSK